MEGSGIALIDSPVSGGFPGAQGGTLTMMAAAPDAVLDKFAGPMEAVSATIHRVGDAAGNGQTVKACLQTLIGSIFSATFEASVLAAKAGVKRRRCAVVWTLQEGQRAFYAKSPTFCTQPETLTVR